MAEDDDKKLASAVSGISASDVLGGAKLGGQIIKAVLGARHRREMRDVREAQHQEIERTIAEPPAIHGSARWATDHDLRGAGLLRDNGAFDSPSSILLGARMGEHGQPNGWLHWDGEGHLVTVAPTRSGKSTMQIVPNLLRYQGSAVVLDPKGELYELTSRWRRTLGPVYRIAPFEPRTDAFNPLEMIRRPADARSLADLMMPEDPRAQEYFRKDAIAFLTGALEYVRRNAPPERATLSEVRRLMALETKDFLTFARRMSESRYPAAAHAGAVVLGKSPDRGIPSLRDTLNSELSVWDDEGVMRATARADFSFHDLKEQTATVYITVPFSMMGAFSAFLRVVLACALDAMIQNPTKPPIPVLFVLDEYLSLGSFSHFKDAIRTHAGAGVRLWFFLQNLATLEEYYPTSWHAFFDAAVQVYFGQSDPRTTSMLSEMLDSTTVAHRSSSYSMGVSLTRQDFLDLSRGESLNVTHTVNLTSRRLMTPGEVATFLGPMRDDRTREAIVRINGVPPMQARLVPYFLGERLRERTGRET